MVELSLLMNAWILNALKDNCSLISNTVSLSFFYRIYKVREIDTRDFSSQTFPFLEMGEQD